MSAAYYTGTAATAEDLHLKMRAALAANGWTLIDAVTDVAGNRDVIYQSATLEAGADDYCYLRLTIAGATWSHRVYTDWDVATNVGSKEAGYAGQVSFSLAGSQYWLRVNEFAVSAVLKITSNYYKMYAGFLRRGMPQVKSGITKTTAGYAAGAFTVNVNTNMTARLKIGQKVVIFNHSSNSGSANYSNSEVLVIQSVAAGSITFATATTLAYDSGAVIGWNPHPAVTTFWTTGATLEGTAAYGTIFHDGVWLSNTGQPLAFTLVVLAPESYVDPDEISMEYQAGIVSAYYTASGKTGFHGYTYHWEAAAFNNQVIEDVMTDGTYNFLVFMTGAAGCQMFGPIS